MDSFSAAAGRGISSAFIFALTAGLLTALTPCVYPMIPITISIFGAKTGVTRGRSFALATLYVAGIAVMFGTLGTVCAMLGKMFGTFLASPWFVIPLVIFFVAMAASMFGAFELALPTSLQARLSSIGGKGFAGAFLMGLVGGIIAAPCTGPPLAGILAHVATTRNAFYGFTLLATYALGIGVPFWAIAGFSMSLPKSGKWMEAVKSVFGIALLVAALYYLKGFAPVLGHVRGSVWAPIVAVVGIAAGAIHVSFHDVVARRLRKGVGVALVSVGLFGVVNQSLAAPDVGLVWYRSEPEAVAEAQRSGRMLLLDFGADWCIPCHGLDKSFTEPAIAAKLKTYTLLKVDCTTLTDDVEQVMQRYKADGLPAVRLVDPSGTIVAKGEGKGLLEPGALERLLR